MPNLLASPDDSTTARVALWGGREFVMLLLASLVAGLATTPYAAFHFHRVTPYGVLANLAAMPVVSAVGVPGGLLGLVAMPFGFGRGVWRGGGGGVGRGCVGGRTGGGPSPARGAPPGASRGPPAP